MRIVVVGGGAAGIGAQGGAKGAAPDAEVILYTEYEDVGYSPCGIPFVHGREIERFEDLILQDKKFYEDAGFDIRYTTRVESIDTASQEIQVAGEGTVKYDRLVLGTGWNYEDPGLPGSDLAGLHYVKNIRRAMEFDKLLDEAKVAVVVDATPIGVEMATAFAHRGLETHFVDPGGWPLADVADPEIMEPVEESMRGLGIHLHMQTSVERFVGEGSVRGVATSQGEIPADVVVVATHKTPNTALATAAGIKTGSTGGIIVDDGMATSAENVWAAGDCVEIPHSVSKVPINGLSGSHAYAQGKVAGVNAGGGERAYQAVQVPWGMVAGTWTIGGVSFGETLATALGIPHVVGMADGISKARYYPGFSRIRVKLLVDPKTRTLVGGQMVGVEGIKERADFLAMAMRARVPIDDIAWMENVYSPPIGALNEPMALAAQNALGKL
ncbi:MAG TPA: FAD-dependent oxidoreductase [Acidimicrobiia bacterium]|nr:FAD-dependent oxidoreductase [Acidimicrobiia bacterium]